MSRLLRSTITAGAGIAAVALIASVTTAAAATGAATAPAAAGTGSGRTTSSSVQAAAGWLATQFEDSTHLPAPGGDHFDSKYGSSYYANYGENADAVFALAAARTGADQRSLAMNYLKHHVGDYTDTSGAQGGPYDGALGKLAVASEVVGGDPTSFGGTDLLATLRADECAATSTTCTPGAAKNLSAGISESFVLIAEARAGGADAPSTAARTYFASLQCTSGGFTGGVNACGSGTADIDSTSYAIMAMTAMGQTGAALDAAVSWLQGQQDANGYWVAQSVPNVNSTGLAASALQGADAGLGRARSWLRSQQQVPGTAGGALRYGGSITATTTSATSPSVLGTAQGLVGLVDGSSLATLTAAGSTPGFALYPPVVKTAYTVTRGAAQTVAGAGFAAGEQVRIRLRDTVVATVPVGPLGGYHATFRVAKNAATGYTSISIVGLSSRVNAAHNVKVVT